jgi:hypothetical protein
MSNTLLPIKFCAVVIIVGGMAMFTLTGCVGYVDRADTSEMYPVGPTVQTTFVIEDDYVYYPSYQIYYSSRRHQYAYRDGQNWISRPAPHGVSIRQLEASPSVRLDFHDSPVQHHETVIRKYPKNWSPPRTNQERNENRKDDHREQRDQRHDNH